MKGLLKKDFYYMKNYKKVILLLFIISILFMVSAGEGDFSFVMGYTTLLMSMAVLNTMAYDEENKGMIYLMALPVKRTEYVLEKYVFGLIIGSVGLLSGLLLVMAGKIIRKENPFQEELFWVTVTFFAFLIISQMIMIPVQLKFGMEKGRIIVILTIMFLAVAGVKTVEILLEKQIITMERVQYVLEAGWIPFLVAAVLVVLYGISVIASIHIIGKKEF